MSGTPQARQNLLKGFSYSSPPRAIVKSREAWLPSAVPARMPHSCSASRVLRAVLWEGGGHRARCCLQHCDIVAQSRASGRDADSLGSPTVQDWAPRARLLQTPSPLLFCRTGLTGAQQNSTGGLVSRRVWECGLTWPLSLMCGGGSASLGLYFFLPLLSYFP